jgi:hypothetical protein
MIARCVLCVCLAGCDGGMILRPDSGGGFDTGRDEPDAAAGVQVPGGVVTGELCGIVTVTGAIEVPAGETLTICAGSRLSIAQDAAITVHGTLRIEGTSDAHVQLLGTSEGRWTGLVVGGTLEADFTDIYDARRAIDGLAGSSIRFDDGLVYAFALNNLQLANGGTFDRTTIRSDDTLVVSGGMLRMTDSTIDLDHPGISPDCVHWGGGGAVLDHVAIINCHCPLHFASATMPVTVTASRFDGAAVPVMIAATTAEFRGNVFPVVPFAFEAIGENADVDIAGNYYGGAAPAISNRFSSSVFRGEGEFLTEEPADAGPR